jgi:serine/threonine-protein kinase
MFVHRLTVISAEARLAEAAGSSTPRLLLFGGIELREIDAAVANGLLAQPKATALLAYLALSPSGRYQRRDLLAALFWPELDQTHARAALRKLVLALRSALGQDRVVSRGDEEIALAAGALSCDVVEFSQAADDGRLVQALDLYCGELMPGFYLAGSAGFGEWLDGWRAAVRERAAAAAWALAHRLEGEEQFTEAGRWARRAVRYTGDDERILRRAMQMLVRLGDKAGAFRLYDDFARQLRRSLEIEPSAETQALLASLKASSERSSTSSA